MSTSRLSVVLNDPIDEAEVYGLIGLEEPVREWERQSEQSASPEAAFSSRSPRPRRRRSIRAAAGGGASQIVTCNCPLGPAASPGTLAGQARFFHLKPNPVRIPPSALRILAGASLAASEEHGEHVLSPRLAHAKPLGGT